MKGRDEPEPFPPGLSGRGLQSGSEERVRFEVSFLFVLSTAERVRASLLRVPLVSWLVVKACLLVLEFAPLFKLALFARKEFVKAARADGGCAAEASRITRGCTR